MATFAPALPSAYGPDGNALPSETLEWTPPDWSQPSIPKIVRNDPIGGTVTVPIIVEVPVYRGPGTFVRAHDSMNDVGYPILTPTNPPIPYETSGGGLNVPITPAPNEVWALYSQYSSWAKPRADGGNEQPSGPGVTWADPASYTIRATQKVDTAFPKSNVYGQGIRGTGL